MLYHINSYSIVTACFKETDCTIYIYVLLLEESSPFNDKMRVESLQITLSSFTLFPVLELFDGHFTKVIICREKFIVSQAKPGLFF